MDSVTAELGRAQSPTEHGARTPDRLEVLARLAEQLNRHGDLEDVLESAVRLTCELLGATSAWLFLRDDECAYEVAAAFGVPPDFPLAQSKEVCRCQRALCLGELTEAVTMIPCERMARVWWEDDGARFHGSVPLVADGRVLGLLNLVFPVSAPAIGDEQLALMTVVGQTISMSVERARLAQRRLEQREAWYASLGRHATDLVIVTDEQGTVRHASQSLERLLGHTPDHYVGTTVAEVFDPDDLPALRRARRAALDSPGLPVTVTARARGPIAGERCFELTITSLLDDPDVAGIVVNARDVTEQVRYRQELLHRSVHDELTGLPNRALLLDRIDQARARIGPRRQLAALLLDLDAFKVVNDTLGREAGDDLLLEISRRLLALAGPGETVARLAGDEFVVLCEGTVDARDAYARAERIRALLGAPVSVADRSMIQTASIGVALAGDAGVAGEDLLRDAEVAMHRAKEHGRAHIELFSLEQRSRLVERLDTERELRLALERDELRLLFQPQVDLIGAGTVGMEALVAWQHPERGLLRAGCFVPLAEETGLIGPLTEWVLARACRFGAELARRRRSEEPPLPIAVNLAVQQLVDPRLVEMVTAALDGTALDPAWLRLEITETGLATDLDEGIVRLQALRELGVGIAVDDFGTGYSSLVRLRRFPVDTLKVDQSFVGGLGRSAEDEAIVKSVIDLAAALGLGVVAEGVERADQRDRLVELGCRHGQGFLWAPGLPAVELLAWIDRPDPAKGRRASRLLAHGDSSDTR